MYMYAGGRGRYLDAAVRIHRLEHLDILQQNDLFLSAFPMFVPSLSW